MKPPVILALALVAGTSLSAQNCDGFYYFTNNSEIVMTNYDKKGSESGKMTIKVSNVSKSGNGITGEYNSELVDDKGKLLAKGNGKYKCDGGIMMIDARGAIPQGNMAAYKDMEIKSDDIYIEYPSSVSAGQAIKDLDFSMSVWNKGNKFSDLSLKESNRKVEGKETVTTAAGTWEAWKITYDGQFKAKIGMIGIPINFKAIEWFAPGFGIVKSETYSKNGKLEGSSQITSFKK